MSDFNNRLREQARSWSADNAPTGLATCPNCSARKPASDIVRENGDWWECTAEIKLPTFVFASLPYRHNINLGHFDPAAPYADRLNKMVCPLFVPKKPGE